ncbi:MAG: IGR protein motif-domain-containing protein [Lentinula lateritia]|uniref:Small ribosomal subunit protein mS41 n=1 Tax=Lentinula lateritia TaxID=40482 RepID=A0ABQ8V3C8_9AGAR|nr:MAG: IGR protein motif-domain-containing protein [Lentinula lateritia]KAJ4472379.1 IGR protein motif-domain-containing protein [Lentinula lateritia]
MFGLVTSSTRAFRPCSTTLLPSLTRSFVNRALTKPVPPATGVLYTLGILHIQLILNRSCTETITTPNDFLKSIGRSMDTKLTSAPESWDDFWRTSGLDMRKVGLSVRDRRYALWCMSKFRRGLAVEEFAHEPKPKKTVRGWGPSVQNGKRIRSKRPKNLKRK